MLVGGTATVTILLAVTLYTGEKGQVQWTPRSILVMAAVLRLLFLFRSPELSDDLYRYLWDGLQILAGHNPYSLAPAEVRVHSESMANLIGYINHAEMITIYPPAAQLIFAAGASLGGGVLGMKALLTGMDLVTCYLIIQVLKALHLPPWRSVLYAWHPLSVLEIAASGHIDGGGILFLFVSISLMAACRADCFSSGTSAKEFSRHMPRQTILAMASGLTFAWAALVKFFPLIFLPVCLICLPKRTRLPFCIGFSAGGIIPAAFFLPDLRKELVTLGVYARHWEFSGFLFKSLHRGVLSGDMVRGGISFLFFLSAAFSYKTFWSDKARLEQAADLSRQSAAPHAKESRGFDIDASRQVFSLALHAFYGIAMAFLLLSPTLYPWYALYLVGISPFAAGPTGLVLAWSVFLSYQVLIPYTLLGLWVEGTWTPALIWLAPISTFLLSVLGRRLISGSAPRTRIP